LTENLAYTIFYDKLALFLRSHLGELDLLGKFWKDVDLSLMVVLKSEYQLFFNKLVRGDLVFRNEQLFQPSAMLQKCDFLDILKIIIMDI